MNLWYRRLLSWPFLRPEIVPFDWCHSFIHSWTTAVIVVWRGMPARLVATYSPSIKCIYMSHWIKQRQQAETRVIQSCCVCIHLARLMVSWRLASAAIRKKKKKIRPSFLRQWLITTTTTMSYGTELLFKRILRGLWQNVIPPTVTHETYGTI